MPDIPAGPDWLQAGWRHVWLPYAQMQTTPLSLPVVATRDSRLILADGRELIDGMASWWTACHGYNHPHIRAAVAHQLEVMPHVMFGGLAHEPGLRLATRLCALLPGDLDHVFFSDSGSVAMEVALKIAVQFWRNRGLPDRDRFIAFRHGYHGDTFATMSVCDPEEGMHSLFRGVMPAQHIVPLPADAASESAFEATLAERSERIAAVVMEPLVQGAGGMKFHAPEVVRRVRAACDRHDVLLILDEIMTGFGRTGTMFACEQAGVVPDIAALSKALTGGTMALAATVARAHVFDAFLADDPGKALMHGPTFMANPLACAAANASLDLFAQEDRLSQVAAVEDYLRHALAPLRDLPGVVDVRVKGAIGVVQVVSLEGAERLRERFVDAGVWVRPFGDIIYLTPPLTIGPADLAALTDAFCAVTRRWLEDR